MGAIAKFGPKGCTPLPSLHTIHPAPQKGGKAPRGTRREQNLLGKHTAPALASSLNKEKFDWSHAELVALQEQMLNLKNHPSDLDRHPFQSADF